MVTHPSTKQPQRRLTSLVSDYLSKEPRFIHCYTLFTSIIIIIVIIYYYYYYLYYYYYYYYYYYRLFACNGIITVTLYLLVLLLLLLFIIISTIFIIIIIIIIMAICYLIIIFIFFSFQTNPTPRNGQLTLVILSLFSIFRNQITNEGSVDTDDIIIMIV